MQYTFATALYSRSRNMFLLETGSPVRAGGRRNVDGFLTASWATSWFPASVTEDKEAE